MNVVLYFGQASDITGKQKEELDFTGNATKLRHHLESIYPGLKGLPYLLAVDQKIAQDQTIISGQHEIALLPPYAGG